MKPLISVIIPIYTAEKYIEKNITVTHENLEFIQKKSDEAMMSIGNIIDLINDENSVDLDREKLASGGFDIKKCVDAALARVHLPQSLELVIICDENEESRVFGDNFHITEAFVNIIQNALEAIEDEHKYGSVLRAKGIVEGEDGNWIRFDYV